MADLTNKVIFISQKKTSMRLATAEWEAIDEICERENIKRNHLIEMINERKDSKIGLTCSVRLFTTIYFYRLLVKNQQNYLTATTQNTTPIFDAIDGIL